MPKGYTNTSKVDSVDVGIWTLTTYRSITGNQYTVEVHCRSNGRKELHSFRGRNAPSSARGFVRSRVELLRETLDAAKNE